jgi:Flp pilus assembly protein TadD
MFDTPNAACEVRAARRSADWHGADAKAACSAEQSFAAAFHLRRLLDLKPDDADDLRKRLAAAQASLKE